MQCSNWQAARRFCHKTRFRTSQCLMTLRPLVSTSPRSNSRKSWLRCLMARLAEGRELRVGRSLRRTCILQLAVRDLLPPWRSPRDSLEQREGSERRDDYRNRGGQDEDETSADAAVGWSHTRTDCKGSEKAFPRKRSARIRVHKLPPRMGEGMRQSRHRSVGCEETHPPGVRIHDCRASAAINLLASGVDEGLVLKIGG